MGSNTMKHYNLLVSWLPKVARRSSSRTDFPRSRIVTFCSVVDKGVVSEFGTHQELIDKQGLYQKLVSAQASHLHVVRKHAQARRTGQQHKIEIKFQYVYTDSFDVMIDHWWRNLTGTKRVAGTDEKTDYRGRAIILTCDESISLLVR